MQGLYKDYLQNSKPLRPATGKGRNLAPVSTTEGTRLPVEVLLSAMTSKRIFVAGSGWGTCSDMITYYIQMFLAWEFHDCPLTFISRNVLLSSDSSSSTCRVSCSYVFWYIGISSNSSMQNTPRNHIRRGSHGTIRPFWVNTALVCYGIWRSKFLADSCTGDNAPQAEQECKSLLLSSNLLTDFYII